MLALVLLKLPAGYKAVLGVNENAIEKLRQSNRAMKQSNSSTLLTWMPAAQQLLAERRGGRLSGLPGKGRGVGSGTRTQFAGHSFARVRGLLLQRALSKVDKTQNRISTKLKLLLISFSFPFAFSLPLTLSLCSVCVLNAQCDWLCVCVCVCQTQIKHLKCLDLI